MLHVLRFWTLRHKISLLIPKMAFQTTKEILPNVESFYFSSKEKNEEISKLSKLLITYIVRMVRSIFISPKDRPDIIITSSHFLYDLFPAVIMRWRFKSKLVVYNHGILRNYRSYDQNLRSNLILLNEKISISLCKSANVIMVVNNEIKENLVMRGFDSNKIVITRNGIDHDFIMSVKAKTEKFDAAFCGRLVKRKGVYVLLDIWEDLLKSLPQSRLVIIGQGEEYDGLKRTIRKKGLEKNVLLTGYVSEEEKFGLLKSSKIFIFPSTEEAWGIAITEGMACGLPVICYDLSAYSFLENGLIKISMGNSKLMLSSIIELLSDEARRTRLGEAAKEESRKLDWQDISNEELRIISTL